MSHIFNYFASFFSDAKKVMRLAFILGVVLSIISIICITGYANDAGLYISLTHAFAINDWSRVFDNMSPLFPVIAGLIAKVGVVPWDSAMIVGCGFYVLTIFPLYGLLSCLMDKKYAAWGSLFYLLAPKMMRYGMTPLLEGSRMFFFILPIYLVFSFARKKNIYKLVLLGIALALLALDRGEGIVSTPVILLALILLTLKSWDYSISISSIFKLVGYCLIPILVMLAVLSPILSYNYHKTGYPVLDRRQVVFVKPYLDKLIGKKPDYSIQGLKISETHVVESGKPSNAKQMPIFSLRRANEFLTDFSRGSYELYLFLALFGIVCLFVRKKWSLEFSLLLLFVAVNALVFFIVSLAYRYFLVNVMLLMSFTLIGYKQIFDWAVKFKVYKVLMLVIFVLAIFQIVNGMDNSIDKSKYYTMQAGTYLREHKSEFMKDSNGYPTIFVLGTDCGTNLFNEFNIINPSRTGLSFTLQDAMKGIPSDKSLSVVIKTQNDQILKPDVIVVFNPEEEPQDVAYLRSQANMKEIKLPGIRETLLFKTN